MTLPKMDIYLNSDAGVSVANVKADRKPLIIDIPREDFGTSESDAAMRLGSVIIATLKIWHPVEMKELLAFSATSHDSKKSM